MTHIINTTCEEPKVRSQSVDRLLELLAQPYGGKGRHLRRLAAAAIKHGNAFVLFLLYGDGIDVTSDHVIDDFADRYVEETFFSWEQARRQLAVLLGWDVALKYADLKDANGDDVIRLLTWDEETVRKRLEDVFQIIEVDDGKVYAFWRDSRT